MPAPRPVLPRSRRTTSSSSEDIGASVLALIAAVEGLPDGSPAAAAYRSALRRKGEALAAAGPVALSDVLARVRASSIDQADAREAILDTAWAGLPGWRLRGAA